MVWGTLIFVAVGVLIILLGHGRFGLTFIACSLVAGAIMAIVEGFKTAFPPTKAAGTRSPAPAAIPAARPRRQPIPERVRHEVWRRDQGHCVDCGSRERLEYDHIIPISQGGSNTARNIELRCESCNRRKGAKV